MTERTPQTATSLSQQFPESVKRVYVRGHFIDWSGRPVRGTVGFLPSPEYMRLLTSKLLMKPVSLIASLDADGRFTVELPVTDDPGITPQGFTYHVSDPIGRSLHMQVPSSTPLLDDPDDPLHGKPVLDIADVYPESQKREGSVQIMRGLPGRGVVAITAIVGGLVFGMSDGSTTTITTPDIYDPAAVQMQIDNSLVDHEIDSMPHPAYDDLPSLAVLFENGLI